MKRSAQPPVVVVVVELCDGSRFRLLPGGPLKLLACFVIWPTTWTCGALQGVRTETLTVTEPPGGSERLRSWTVKPLTVAVPCAGAPIVALRTEKPAGAVRFDEPSCCCDARFVY